VYIQVVKQAILQKITTIAKTYYFTRHYKDAF